MKKMTIHDLLCMATGHARCPVTKAMEENKPLNAVVTYVSNEPSNMKGVLELTWNTIVDKQ